MAQGIAAIGECMLELSGQGGNTWHMGYAGDTFNTLWTLRALSAGHHVDYISAFGDDPFSEGQTAFFREHGIGIANSPIISGAHPGLYAITLKGAERSFTYWRNDAAARQLANDPAKLAKSLENRSLIYFSGITLAILTTDARQALLKAVSTERAKGCHIAFDPNYRPRLWPSAEAARSAIASAWRSLISPCRLSPTNRNSMATPHQKRRRPDWSAQASPKSSSRTATSRR